jgi:hypothetical protein
MSDYSNYIERDQFNDKICELVEEYLDNIDSYPDNIVLAIDNKTNEIKLCEKSDIIDGCDTFAISALIRDNEEQTAKEVDIDETFEIASKYFFVR